MHTAFVARKANRLLVLIMINPCFNTLDSTSFVTLYMALTCPILVYGNVVYMAHATKEIGILWNQYSIWL